MTRKMTAELGLKPGAELLLGGPGPSRYGPEIRAFIERFARDRDPRKRMDFIVYHDYDRKTQMLEDLRWTPYGCSLKMHALLRREQVRCDSAVANARGVFGLASRDRSAVTVLLWNYQHAGTDAHRVALRVENLPDTLAGGPVRVRTCRIDSTQSNCYHDPARGDLERTEERTEPCGREFLAQVPLEPNALALVELLPGADRR